MGNKALKNRTPIGSAVSIDLFKQFKELSFNTKIPMSKLLDEALEYIIKKYKASK